MVSSFFFKIYLHDLNITQVFQFVLILYDEKHYSKWWLIFENISLKSFRTESPKPCVPINFFPPGLEKKK